MNINVRESMIAGTWYPGQPDELQKTIETFYSHVKKESVNGEIVGLISPHAGYIYSGQVAAHGYHQLIGKKFDLVCILSPLHRMALGKYAIHSASYYHTPLGDVPVARKLIQKLQKDVEIEDVMRDEEHSLEIQLPFLQVTLGKFQLLPIMVGHGDVYRVNDIVDPLVRLLSDRNSLVVASTDLHHISNYHEVVERDREVVIALEKFDLNGIREVLSKPDSTVCGRVPISIVTDVTTQMGANQFHVFCHSNSGDVTGEKNLGQYTVGYLSGGMIKK